MFYFVFTHFMIIQNDFGDEKRVTIAKTSFG